MKRTLFASLLLASTAFAQLVPWTLETSTVPSNRAGDPTFVFVAEPPGAGVQLIVGTDTANTGIFLWPPDQLQGPLVLSVGPVSAADSRGSMLVVTSPVTNALLVYRVTDAGLVALDTGTFNVPTARQVALAQLADGGFEVWVDTSSTVVEHYTMSNGANGSVAFTSLPSITVAEVPSGLAVDDRSGRLYVAQPTLGVMTVERNGTSAFLISLDGGQLGQTVGGIDLFLAADGSALLFSAAPTEVEIKVHAHSGSQATFLTALQLGDTDGGSGRLGQPKFLDVYERPVPGFPRGLLVVQDELSSTYKVVSLADVDAVFPLPEPFGGGLPDGGSTGDGGTATDAGTTDAGTPTDAGSSTGGGGGSGGRPPGPTPGVEPTPTCGCTGGPIAGLPALLLLWWIRRLRSTRP